MTGWRMGWAVGPKHLIDAMHNVQSQQTACPSSVSQYALLAALDGPQDCVAEMRREFAKRRDLVCEALREIPGLNFPTPEGAFYVFFDVRAYLNKSYNGVKVTDSLQFCQAALEQAHVNFVAGAAFGAEGFARMSFATGEATLREGLERFTAWLKTGE